MKYLKKKTLTKIQENIMKNTMEKGIPTFGMYSLLSMCGHLDAMGIYNT